MCIYIYIYMYIYIYIYKTIIYTRRHIYKGMLIIVADIWLNRKRAGAQATKERAETIRQLAPVGVPEGSASMACTALTQHNRQSCRPICRPIFVWSKSSYILFGGRIGRQLVLDNWLCCVCFWPCLSGDQCFFLAVTSFFCGRHQFFLWPPPCFFVAVTFLGSKSGRRVGQKQPSCWPKT
jgi:hypothetical protein